MWLSDFYLWAQRKIQCIFSCLSCLGWFVFILLWIGCWDLGPLFKRQIQTIERPCRLHALAVSETKHRQQWANETRQEHREIMKKQDSDTGNKGWGYGAEKMPEVMGDGESGRIGWIIENAYLHKSWKYIPKPSAIRQKSAENPSSVNRKLVQRFKFMSWELFLSPWYKQNKSKTKSSTSFSFQQVCGHNPDRYPSDKQSRGEDPYSQDLLCPDLHLPGFHLAYLGSPDVFPVLKSSNYPSSEEVSPTTNCMASVKKCTSLWIIQIASISRKRHSSRQCPSSQVNAHI